MHVSSHFDSGNIEVVDQTDPANVHLKIRKDAGEDHFQWFHFRVTGARGMKLTLHIDNASLASYPDGWRDYQACASWDRKNWTRVHTRYDGRTLTIEHEPQSDTCYYAYFAPYSLERHADLIARISASHAVEYERLGATVDKRDLDLLRLGEPNREGPICWIIARQHPGETMAEWFVEGLLERLVDPSDAVARHLLTSAVFYVVPNMNPDGSFRGHLRNNAAGANLNRAWQTPSVKRSPEVFLVRSKMQQTGVDFFLDVHGDEALPYNFISGSEGIPRWDKRLATLQSAYIKDLQNVSPDFQTTFGYPIDDRGSANLKLASNWVGQAFGCLSMTLEQPFKDTANHPHADGWSPERARRFGQAQLDVLWRLVDRLR